MRAKEFVRQIVNLSALGLFVLSVLPYLHEHWWVFELPSHFRLHIGVVSIVFVVAALILRSSRAAALAAGAASVSWIVVLSVSQSPLHEGPGLTIVSQNLSASNGSSAIALGELLEQDADILVLQEYTPEWQTSLATLANRYPHVITVPQNGAFGIAVFSRIPIVSQQTLFLGTSRTPFIHVELESPSMAAHLVAVHFTPPMTREWSADRNQQFVELQNYLQTLKKPFVVVGDFNNTPYSPVLRSFMAETGTSVAWSRHLPTWPTSLGALGIPIDLVIASDEVSFNAVSTIEPIGSDHRGLRIQLDLGNPRPTGEDNPTR